MDKLSKREYAQDMNARKTSINIRAHRCKTCSFLSEARPDFCFRKGHIIDSVSTIKRFFECGKCGKRENCLDGNSNGKSPTKACGCGAFQWVACGSQGSGNAFAISASRGVNGEKLLLAASDWTTKGDTDSMAERVGRLK